MSSPVPSGEEGSDDDSFDEEKDFVEGQQDRPTDNDDHNADDDGDGSRSCYSDERSYYSDERSSRSYYSDERSYYSDEQGSYSGRDSSRREEDSSADSAHRDDHHDDSFTTDNQGSFQSAGEASHTDDDRDRSSRSDYSGERSYDSRETTSYNSRDERSYDSQDESYRSREDDRSYDSRDKSYNSEQDDRSYDSQDDRSYDSREVRGDAPPGDDHHEASFHPETPSSRYDENEASFAEESPLPPPTNRKDDQSFGERSASYGDSQSHFNESKTEESVAAEEQESPGTAKQNDNSEQSFGDQSFYSEDSQSFADQTRSFNENDLEEACQTSAAFDDPGDFDDKEASVDKNERDASGSPPAPEHPEREDQEAKFEKGFPSFEDSSFGNFDTAFGGTGTSGSDTDVNGRGAFDKGNGFKSAASDTPVDDTFACSSFDNQAENGNAFFTTGFDTANDTEKEYQVDSSEGFAAFDAGDDPFGGATGGEDAAALQNDFSASFSSMDKGDRQSSGEKAKEVTNDASTGSKAGEDSKSILQESDHSSFFSQDDASFSHVEESRSTSGRSAASGSDGGSVYEEGNGSVADESDSDNSSSQQGIESGTESGISEGTNSHLSHEMGTSQPGTANITFLIKEPNPDKKTLIILCTMFPTSEEEVQIQDRSMKLCKANGIVPHIIMGQQKPPQRDELLSISNLNDFPQFFLCQKQHVEFLGGFPAVQQMVEDNEFNPSMLEPSPENVKSEGEESVVATNDDDEMSDRLDGFSTDGDGVSTYGGASFSTGDPSDFSRSFEGSRSTILGESSLRNDNDEGSRSFNSTPGGRSLGSVRSNGSASMDDGSEGALDQDESLRSGSKFTENQDESLRSNPDVSDSQYAEDSARSESQSYVSDGRSSQSNGTSFKSENAESETSSQQNERLSFGQNNEQEHSTEDFSNGSQAEDNSSSTQKSPSMDGPFESGETKDKTEEFEESMMIGEVFGQPNELFEDFNDKQNLKSVNEDDEQSPEIGEEDHSSFAGEDESSFSGDEDYSSRSEQEGPVSSQGSQSEESLSLQELTNDSNGASSDGTEAEDGERSVSGGEKPERQIVAIVASPVVDKNVKKKRKKKRNKRRREAKSPALLDFAANVNDAMLDLEEFEEINEDIMDSSAHRLLLGFDALLGIFLQLSDELELISTFAKAKKKKDRDALAPVQALKAVLSFADTFDQLFDDLKPIILDCFEEDPDEEMDDLLYRLNSLVDLLCETTHRVGDRQEWNERSETTYVTLLELMERDALDLRCYFDDVETPDQGVSANIHEAWSATGHIEELRALQYADDPWIFRQICYEVMVSTDQWCPDTSMLMEICGIDPEMLEEEPDPEYLEEDELAPVPQAAEHVLDKVNGDPLPRPVVLASILRRIIPPRAVTDATLLDHFTSIRNTLDSPLGLSATNIVSITSVPETVNDPEALGVGGMGKTTLASMVAQHPDVRRYFIDGVVWVYVGDKELNYARYTQCLRELVAQLDFYQGVPLFAELLHNPGEPISKRRRREEGFMIYARDTIAELLHDRSVLIILDDVCFEPDLDWFDFAPMPGEEIDDLESNCALLVTTRCRTLLPAADTVEVDMLEEADAISLLIQESGQLSHALLAESREARSVVRECANHPLAVKSVGRWLNLKHATAGVRSSVEEIHAEVIKSMDKILKGGNHAGNDDMLYEIMSMSLSPAINGDPTNIIKFCLAAFIVVFCDREYISDFALTEPTPIIPMDMAELLFETLLEMNESSLLQKGSLFYAQKKEAAVLIPEALSALGVLKVITYSDAEDDEEDPEDEQKFLQVMHFIHHEYGEYLAKEDPRLHDLTKEAERTWNRALVEAYLSHVEEWDIDLEDAAHSYALEMVISHMIRGGMYSAAAELLADKSFVRGRLLSLGRENSTRRHIKDCEMLFSKLRERRPRGSKLEPRSVMKQAYQALGSQLAIDDEEQSIEDSRIKDVEVARAHYEIGFSLAEKRCWDAAIAHWETSQELLESALGTVEVVAGILYNIGVVYSEINEYEQALDSLKQCLRIRGSIHGESHILYAQTIQKIGDIFLNMSDYHEAMESYNWALDVMYTEPAHHRVEIGEILDNKGTIHYSKGEIDEALQCHQEALRSKQVDLGEDHPELAATYHHIGNCLSDQGNVEDAIAHFEEAIRLKEIDPEGGPERDADVLTIEGILHNLEGNQEQGLECYEKSLQILVTKVPHRKEKVASLLHLIGCVYLMSGEQKKAMKLFEESLQARRKVLGFVHLDVASTLFNMAFLHQTRNRLDRALKCLEEALKIRQLRLPDSEKVAVTHEKIGSLARAIGKTKKAQIAFEEALRIRRLVHGEQHEAVATVLQELGDLMDDLGEYDSAMSYYIDALDIRRNRLGLDDIAVAETLYSMGYTLHNNDEPERALVCFEESLSIRRYQLGADSKEVGDVLNMMGFLKAKRGELDDALTLLWDSLRIRKLQEDHVKVSETLKNIGNVHREKQEQELAIECYEECLRIRRAELGADHEKVADALIAMGNVESDMQRTDDAMSSFQEALKIRTQVFGEHDESVAAVLQFMGTLEFRANNHARARDLLTEFIRIRRDNGTKNDGDYVNVLFMLGNLEKLQNNETAARGCWMEAYQVFQELGLADTNPQIAKVMNHLLQSEDLEAQDTEKDKKSLFGKVKDKLKKEKTEEDEPKMRTKGRKSRKGKGVQL